MSASIKGNDLGGGGEAERNGRSAPFTTAKTLSNPMKDNSVNFIRRKSENRQKYCCDLAYFKIKRNG
jgi:hypothetical protein